MMHLIRIALAAAAILASGVVLAAAPVDGLPSASVYQLNAKLVDQSGRPVTWASQRGRPRVVTMFYSSCPYMCPLIIDSGKAIEHALTPVERARLGITLVSIDPVRDSPKVLAALALRRKLDPARWTLLRPAPADVRKLAGLLGIRYRALADGEFNHTSALLLLDADGRVLARTEQIGSKADPEFVAAVRKSLAAAKVTSGRSNR